MTTLSIRIRGRVQNVGFRAFVAGLALARGVTGSAWNRRDGEVEVSAQHERREELDKFVSDLWSGPGRVTGVEATEVEGAGQYEGFRIGPTR